MPVESAVTPSHLHCYSGSCTQLAPIIFSRSDSPQRREERRGFLAGDLGVLPVSAVSPGISFGYGLAALGSPGSICGFKCFVQVHRSG